MPRRLIAAVLLTGLLATAETARGTSGASDRIDPKEPTPPTAETEPAPLIESPAKQQDESPAGPPITKSPGTETDQADSEPALPAEITPSDYLLLPRVGRYRRAALHIDPVEVAIATGEWHAPTAGETVVAAGGEAKTWSPAQESQAEPGGYAYAEFDSPADGVLLLEAPGAAAVCLNGDWVVGDPYGVGWLRPPVTVREGSNWVLLHLANPAARARLVAPDGPVALLATQAVLPDLIAGDESPLAVSVLLSNASAEPLADAEVVVTLGDGEPETTTLRWIESLLVTPITLTLPALPEIEPGQDVPLRVEVRRRATDDDDEQENTERPPLASTELTLRCVASNDPHRRTFVSEIDGSVQPYAVRPASEMSAGGASPAGEAIGPKPGVLLVLHDAGQSPAECADTYGRIDGLHVVAPGGRGAWGFDWEDWSARDAMEALADFESRSEATATPSDPRRVTITGRGMGGHGALWLGVLRPDRFAAVAPQSGWISLFTHGGAGVAPGPGSPLAEVLGRQAATRDPLRLLANLSGTGVYVFNDGGARGVAASEGRLLRRRLGEFHRDFAYYEMQDATPGDSATAWAPLLEFARQRLGPDPSPAATPTDRVDFATPDLGAASSRGWVTIEGLRRAGAAARVTIERDRSTGEVVGTTDNVRRLRLSFARFRHDGDEGRVRVRIDGGKPVRYTPGRNGDDLRLVRDHKGAWRRLPPLIDGLGRRRTPIFKSPERPGGLKSVFDHRPLLVYGTRGDEEARRWAVAKARYDAHLFLYRGAGRLEVTPDTGLMRSLTRERRRDDLRRSVVLYGNGDTNGAYRLLLRGAPIDTRAGRVLVGARPESDGALAVMMVRPRRGAGRASVALIGGTGPVGMRLTTRLRYFWSGVAYPDLLLMGPAALNPPSGEPPEDDVRAAGYFDPDWGIDGGGVVWRDLAI